MATSNIIDLLVRPLPANARCLICRREINDDRQEALFIVEGWQGDGKRRTPCPFEIPHRISHNRAKLAVRGLRLWYGGKTDERDRRAACHLLRRSGATAIVH